MLLKSACQVSPPWFLAGRWPNWMPGAITWASFAIVVAFSLLRTVGKTEDFQDADFGAYFHAGRLVSQGQTPYVIHGRIDGAFVYSPAFAYLFLPLQPLGYLGACRVWMVITLGLCLACVILSMHLVFGHQQGRPVPWGTLWLGLLPAASYFWNNVRVGQTGALVLAACLAWALCRRRGRPFLGGLFLACACAVKITPVLLLPYLIMRRDWRGLSGAFAGGLALILLPAFWVGPEGVVSLHPQWVEQTLHTQTLGQTIRAANQSVLGLLARLPAISNGETCFATGKLMAVQRSYPLIALTLAAGLYAAIAWNLRKRQSTGSGAEECRTENLHISLLLILITLIHPRAWTCNFVALLLPCFMLAQCFWQRQHGWKLSLAGLLLLTLANVLPPFPSSPSEWSWTVWFDRSRHFWGGIMIGLAAHRASGKGADPLTQPMLSCLGCWENRVSDSNGTVACEP